MRSGCVFHFFELFWVAVVWGVHIMAVWKQKKRIRELQEELAEEERDGDENGDF